MFDFFNVLIASYVLTHEVEIASCEIVKENFPSFGGKGLNSGLPSATFFNLTYIALQIE